eukprot:1897439-Rhodomonas_salina.1
MGPSVHAVLGYGASSGTDLGCGATMLWNSGTDLEYDATSIVRSNDLHPEYAASYEGGYAALVWSDDGTFAQGLVPGSAAPYYHAPGTLV